MKNEIILLSEIDRTGVCNSDDKPVLRRIKETLKRIDVEKIVATLKSVHRPMLPLKPEVWSELAQAIVNYLTEEK